MLNCDFQLGSLVLLSPTSKYVGASSANPEGVVGEVIPYAGHSWVRVKWSNGHRNVYSSVERDLIPLLVVEYKTKAEAQAAIKGKPNLTVVGMKGSGKSGLRWNTTVKEV